MNAKIAIFTQDEFIKASTASRLRATTFEKINGSWKQADDSYVNLSNVGADSVRENIKKLIDRISDCQIAAGLQISGTLYRELDIRGFSIFEVRDFEPETLDGILQDLNDTNPALVVSPNVLTRPIETETTGVYQLNLVKLQAEHPDVSSKQALQEFLETTPFYELRLSCTHIPPWIELGPYDISSTPADGLILAAVRKKQC